jgi:hypothetical protein
MAKLTTNEYLAGIRAHAIKDRAWGWDLLDSWTDEQILAEVKGKRTVHSACVHLWHKHIAPARVCTTDVTKYDFTTLDVTKLTREEMRDIYNHFSKTRKFTHFNSRTYAIRMLEQLLERTPGITTKLPQNYVHDADDGMTYSTAKGKHPRNESVERTPRRQRWFPTGNLNEYGRMTYSQNPDSSMTDHLPRQKGHK